MGFLGQSSGKFGKVFPITLFWKLGIFSILANYGGTVWQLGVFQPGPISWAGFFPVKKISGTFSAIGVKKFWETRGQRVHRVWGQIFHPVLKARFFCPENNIWRPGSKRPSYNTPCVPRGV